MVQTGNINSSGKAADNKKPSLHLVTEDANAGEKQNSQTVTPEKGARPIEEYQFVEKPEQKSSLDDYIPQYSGKFLSTFDIEELYAKRRNVQAFYALVKSHFLLESGPPFARLCYRAVKSIKRFMGYKIPTLEEILNITKQQVSNACKTVAAYHDMCVDEHSVVLQYLNHDYDILVNISSQRMSLEKELSRVADQYRKAKSVSDATENHTPERYSAEKRMICIAEKMNKLNQDIKNYRRAAIVLSREKEKMADIAKLLSEGRDYLRSLCLYYGVMADSIGKVHSLRGAARNLSRKEILNSQFYSYVEEAGKTIYDIISLDESFERSRQGDSGNKNEEYLAKMRTIKKEIRLYYKNPKK